MDQKEKLIIPIEEVWKSFQEHLDVKNNNRILFSWKYWTWKTYFLNEFFNSKKDEYEVFNLYPINYQISQNEDIVNFLKYDILVELLKKDKENNLNLFEKTEITSFLDYSILSYLFFSDKEKLSKSIKTWIEFIPELGRPISETVWIFEKFFWFKEQIETWEKWIIEDFLNQIKNTKITENDLISELVKNKIKEIKWNKKSILILDDLDRIDPEHIFRLLNIFWAHFDNKNNDLPNKFWFDKIILVCDYENIKGIFEHRYWEKADFCWYIDKFFSIEYFDFNKNFIIEFFIKLIIKNYVIKFPKLKDELVSDSYYSWLFFSSVLKHSSNLKWRYKISLREILKPINFQITYLNNWYQGEVISLINILLKTLQTIFWWNKEYLLEILQNIRNSNNIWKKYTEDTSISKLNIVYKIYIYHIIIHIYSNKESFDFSDIIHLWYNFSLNTNTQSIENLKENVKIYEMFYDILIDYISNYLE